jgi:hypothetical protein
VLFKAPNRLCVSLAAGARPVHPIRDARLSDLETELEQLAMDARRKDGVLGTHNKAEAISLRRTSELSLLFLRGKSRSSYPYKL